MDKKEAKHYIDKWEPIMSSIINAAAYRTLGQSSIHTSIDEMEKFVRAEQEHGRYDGELVEMFPWGIPHPILGKHVKTFIWKDVNLSKPGVKDPFTVDIWMWGKKPSIVLGKRVGGVNTVFSRHGWWKSYFIRGKLQECNFPRIDNLGEMKLRKAAIPRIQEKKAFPRLRCYLEWLME